MSARAKATAAHYIGNTARTYESDRERQVKWSAERRILDEWLIAMCPVSNLLDIPVGTGRFFDIYDLNEIAVTGIDISEDMLSEARAKGYDFDLRLGNILAIDMPDGAVDVAVCIRLLNMLEPGEMRLALAELQRVARKAVIISLRVGGDEGRLTRPQTVDDVSAALAPGWRIAEDREVHKPRYRMIRLAHD
jgi:ubiquinone/menaquinone biosynthesis C-methylase UbiE